MIDFRAISPIFQEEAISANNDSVTREGDWVLFT